MQLLDGRSHLPHVWSQYKCSGLRCIDTECCHSTPATRRVRVLPCYVVHWIRKRVFGSRTHSPSGPSDVNTSSTPFSANPTEPRIRLEPSKIYDVRKSSVCGIEQRQARVVNVHNGKVMLDLQKYFILSDIPSSIDASSLFGLCGDDLNGQGWLRVCWSGPCSRESTATVKWKPPLYQ
jgi:hypothetical protein